MVGVEGGEPLEVNVAKVMFGGIMVTANVLIVHFSKC